MKSKSSLRAIIVISVFILVASCGGGSSSGGGGGGGGGSGVSDDVCGGATKGCISGSVQKSDGAAISSVTVTLVDVAAGAQVIKAESDLATANEQGWYSASGIEAGDRVICFSATGYFKVCRTVTVVAKTTTQVTPTKLVAEGTPETVATVQNGGNASVNTTGARIDFPAGSVCDASGNAVTGDIDCDLQAVDITGDDIALAPSSFQAVAADGSEGIMLSSGMMAVKCEQNDAELTICSGQTATVRIPVYGADAECKDTNVNPTTGVTGWRFNEETGVWNEFNYGDCARSCGGTAPGTAGANQYYTCTIDHLSWINADRLVDDTCLTGSVVGTAGGVGNPLTTIRCYGDGWQNDAYAATTGTFCAPAPVNRPYTCTAGNSTRWIDPAEVKTGTAGGTVVEFPVSSCPADGCTDIGEFEFASSIVTTTLTWGSAPDDLDSHFVSSSGEQVYFGNKGVAGSVNKGSLIASPYIELDTDDTSSFGPEITTVLSQVADGTYRFCVRNYSGEAEGSLYDSSASVRVEIPNQGSGSAVVSETRSVPTSGSTTGSHLMWQVYEIVISNGIVTSYENLDTVVDSTSQTTAAAECFE